jgi:hypothetical protein
MFYIWVKIYNNRISWQLPHVIYSCAYTILLHFWLKLIFLNDHAKSLPREKLLKLFAFSHFSFPFTTSASFEPYICRHFLPNSPKWQFWAKKIRYFCKDVQESFIFIPHTKVHFLTLKLEQKSSAHNPIKEILSN